jgi:release factor glutamine methyltransferase
MEIYQPAEDSYFLAEIVKKHLKDKNIKICDMGTGSGFQSKNLISFGVPKQNILAVDLNPQAIKNAKSLGIPLKISDLFSNIKQKFDLILFNPPYLPQDKFDKKIDTTGGKKGDEIISKFISQLFSHLNPLGSAFLLTSSMTPDSWKKVAKINNLSFKKIATKNIFFEKLYIWEITQLQ